MGKILSDHKKENLLSLIEIHTQIKHFNTLHPDLTVSKRRKAEILRILLEKLENQEISYEQFYSWLALHQLDGNNCFFVYEMTKPMFSKDYFDKLIPSLLPNVRDILEYNANDLCESTLVNMLHDVAQKRAIFTYISPANILKKIQGEDGVSQKAFKQIYYANIIINYDHNIIIVSINPTAHLEDVEGVEKGREFSQIASFYLKKIKSLVGEFYIRVPTWIPDALNRLAKEATYHNNEEIENKLNEATPIVEEMVSKLTEKYGLNDQALVYYMTEEFLLTFENALVDKYGVKDKGEESYSVFEQKGDQVNTLITISCNSETSDLKHGRVAKVAKATRNNSEITQLGLITTINNERYRFYIKNGEDYFLIKSKSIKFTKEEVIRNVIERLEFYRKEIQSESSDFCD